MMRWIVGSSLKFRFIVIAVAAALMYFGIARLHDMPVDVFPEFAPPLVEIQTPSSGSVGRGSRGARHDSAGASAQRRSRIWTSCAPRASPNCRRSR